MSEELKKNNSSNAPTGNVPTGSAPTTGFAPRSSSPRTGFGARPSFASRNRTGGAPGAAQSSTTGSTAPNTSFNSTNSVKPRGTFFKPRPRFNSTERTDLETVMISLRAVSKTRAGGRQRSFSVLMLSGNKKGLIGYGTGKSADISEAIKKAERRAKSNLFKVGITGTSIAHDVSNYYCGVQIIAKRVPQGTGMKVGGVARKVFSLAGITDVSCKCIGNSMSNHNVVYGLVEALSKVSRVSEIANRLGKTVKEIVARTKKTKEMRYENTK